MTTRVQQLGALLRNGAYDAVFRWALFIALIALGSVILWDYGFLAYLFESDSSRISFVIIALFIGFSAYCLYVLLMFARELRFVSLVADKLASSGGEADGLQSVAAGLPGSRFLGTYFADVQQKERLEAGGDRSVLLQSLTADFRKRARVGTYAADLLYKLGMLGTVIGFVIMLNSMGDLSNFDVDTLRGALQRMTGGMAVALLTTIAGLVCGILLRVQFNIAEALASDVLQATVRVTEVSLVPLLRKNAGNV